MDSLPSFVIEELKDDEAPNGPGIYISTATGQLGPFKTMPEAEVALNDIINQVINDLVSREINS